MLNRCLSGAFWKIFPTKVFALVVMTTGVVAFAANFSGVDFISLVSPRFEAMQASESLAFAAVGLSLLLLVLEEGNVRLRHFLGAFFASLAIAIGVACLWHGFMRAGLGDEFWNAAGHGPYGAWGRMPFATSLSLMCLGSSLFLCHACESMAVRLVDGLVLVSLGLGMNVLLGVTYSFNAVFAPIASLHMSLPAAFLDVLASVAVIFHQPTKGLMAEFVKPQAGGHMARYLLPLFVFVFVTLSIGMAKLLGEMFGIFSPATGWSLIMMAHLCSFAALIWYQAKMLNAYDARQKMQARALSEKAKLIDLTSDAVIVRNLAGTILFWNHGAETLYGWAKQDAIGQHFSDIVATETSDDVDFIQVELTMTGRWTGEAKQKTKSGRIVSVMSRWVLEKGVDGHEDRVLETNTDLTERTLAQKAIRRSEDRLAMALEASRMALWEIDCVTKNIARSPSHDALFGLKEPLAHWDLETLKSFVHPDDRRLISLSAFLGGEKAENREFEFRVIWPNGSVHWLLQKGRAIFHHGAPVSVAGVLIDVTDRKNSEAALRRSEAFNKRIVENTSDCITVLDKHGRVNYVSPGGQKDRVGEENAVCQGRAWLDFWADEAKPAVKKALEDTMLHGHGRFQGSRPTASGTMRWWDVVLTAATDSSHRVEDIIAISRDITSQMQAEKALRESEDRLRLSIESTGLGLWDYAMPSGHIDLSDRARRIFGLQPYMMPTFDMFLQSVHPGDREHVERAICKALDPKGSGYFQQEYRYFDISTGGEKWLSGTGQAFFSGEGVATRFLGTILDVTVRKVTEARLKESSDRLRRLVDANPIGVVVGDFSGRHIKEANQAFLDLIGATRAELEAGYLCSRLPSLPASRLRDREAWREIRTQGRCAPYEKQLCLPDGSVLHVLVGFSLLDAKKREGVGFVLDVTPRKKMEQQLARSNRLFEQIADTTPDLLYIFDLANLNLIFANSSAAKILGYAPPALTAMGRDVLEKLVHPEDLRELGELRHVFAALKEGEVYEHEYRMRHENGSYRWIRCREVVFSRDTNGRALSVLGLGRDVTENRRTEVELRRAKEEADAANRAKTAFLANMSHEIRTPIGVIMGFTEIALSSPASTPDQGKALQTIRRNAHQLNCLIDDVLDISKVEAGCLQIDATPFSLADLLEDVSASLSLPAREKGIRFSVESLGTVPNMVVADPMRLRQCLVNVVGNAIKFTEEGHVTVTLQVVDSRERTASTRTSCLEFVVQDTGVGLCEEQIRNLFRPFSQADQSVARRYGGTGLGLLLSRNLARAMGGDLVLRESQPCRGSTFVLRVEIEVPAEPGAKPEGRPSAVTAWNEGCLDGVRVLLVEDAPDNQLLVSKLLKMSGVHVDIAGDGIEGVRKAMQGNYDIVLMDIQMPLMDGYAATAALRAKGYKKPVVALTAHAFQEEREKSFSTGFTDYLTKPVHRDELVGTVMRLVRPTVKQRNWKSN